MPADPQPGTGPGWFTKLVNFSRASVRHAWHGLPQTPTPEQERRLGLCLACDQLDAATGACTHPGCGCRVAVKTTWLMERCPLGRW
jgi:hypothetical protein